MDIASMYPGLWHLKKIKDLTLEDALEAYGEGFYFVCGDGKIKFITNDWDAVK